MEHRSYKSIVIFQDMNVGEYQYELIGKTILPELYISKIQRQCYQDEVINIDFIFSLNNVQLEKCKPVLVERNSKSDKKNDFFDKSSRAKYLKTRPLNYSVE